MTTISVSSNKNLSSRVLFGSHTATAAAILLIGAEFTGLNGAAATITVDVDVVRSGNTYGGPRYAFAKRSTTSTRETTPDPLAVFVAAGDVVNVYATSTNASDTAVQGRVYVQDRGELSPIQSFTNAQGGGMREDHDTDAPFELTTSAEDVKTFTPDKLPDWLNVTAIAGDENTADAAFEIVGKATANGVEDELMAVPSGENPTSIRPGETRSFSVDLRQLKRRPKTFIIRSWLAAAGTGEITFETSC